MFYVTVQHVLPVTLVLFIAGHVPVARGIKCLACADVANARDCAYVKECPSHQVCYGELFAATTTGTLRYRVGCRDKSACGQGVSQAICSECCDSPLCNSQLCYDPGYGPRSSRGPVCYNCPNLAEPAQCDKVKVCSVVETCGAIEYTVGLMASYRVVCVPKTICNALHAQDTCTGCCTDDLCTHNCTARYTQPQTTQTPSTSTDSMTPAASTTPTATPMTPTATTSTSTATPMTSTATPMTSTATPMTSTTTPMTSTATTSTPTATPMTSTATSMTSTATTTPAATSMTSTSASMFSTATTTLTTKTMTSTGRTTTPTASPTTTQKPAMTSLSQTAVDGQWSSWLGWSACSATCGTGERTRTRVCGNPIPAHGGNGCVGNSLLIESCHAKSCPATTKRSPVCIGCRFDHHSFCNWGHSSNHWHFEEGASGSGDMYGPQSDYHNTHHGIGSYVYIHWGHHASLTSPLIKTESRWCFSVHLYSHGHGDAGILIYTRNERTGKERPLMSLYGDHGRRWIHKQAVLHPNFRSSDYRLGIKTMAEHGTGFIGIDDMELCEC